MPKYRVHAVIDATKYLGEFEADSKEQAEELAWESDNQNVTLCHRCAYEVEVGDMVRVVVEEIEDGA